MAKINTRQPDPQSDLVVQQLQELLESATNGMVGVKASARFKAGDDVPTLVENIRDVIDALTQTAQSIFDDMTEVMHDNMVLTVKLARTTDVLENFVNVTFDDALDHATIDLMEAFAATGGADVTANGELGFDSSVLFSQADIRPILLQAIGRYVEEEAEAMKPNLPREAPPGLLESMAMRYRHDFWLQKDPDGGPLQCGVSDEERAAILRVMAQLYEEVSGHGFYRYSD